MYNVTLRSCWSIETLCGIVACGAEASLGACEATAMQRFCRIENLTAMKDIDAQRADKMLVAATGKSEEIGAKVKVAIVDTGACLTTFPRIDGAWPERSPL